MKKILPFLLGLYSILIYGQNASINQQININSALNAYQVGTPDMSSFQKVSQIPMNSYTGRAEVNIPLYEIKSGDISVPISISYNTSGVKVEDIPSSIGSNWSLNAGGNINKTVKGVEDFYYSAEKFTNDASNTFSNYTINSLGWFHYNDYKANPSLNDLLGDTTPFTLPSGTGGLFIGIWGEGLTENDDYRPDLFTANAPGLNTSFVHRKDKSPMEINSMGNAIVSTFGESDSIDLFGFFDGWEGRRKIKCIRNIDITNPAGIVYSFGDLDISQSADVTPNKRYNREHENDIYSYNQVDAYHLSSIKSVSTNKRVSFKYNTYNLSNDEGRVVSYYNLYGRDLDKVPVVKPGIYYEQYFINKYPQLNRLDKILFDEGSVEFIHSKSREDLVGDQALVFIKIKDFHGITIKTFKFEYDYFIADTNCSESKCKRLKLLKIRVFGKNGKEIPGYEFSYDEKRLPERDAFNQDFLGYANAPTSSLIGGAPTLFYAPNKGELSFFPVSLGREYRPLTGAYSMKANLEYSKAGVLTRIKYPTGAYTDFAYELNSFLVNDVKVKGAGLRLKSQRIVDESGHQEILDYRYIDTNGKPSGRLNAIPLYGKAKLGPWGTFDGDLTKVTFDIYTSSQSQAELTDGAYVGYSRVLIKNRENHGITENIYSSAKDEPDLVAPLFDLGWTDGSQMSTEISSYQVDFLNKNGGFQDLPIDRGMFRGKLKLQRLYDFKGKLLSRKDIKYTNDKYTSIPLNYVRKESDLVESGGQPTRITQYLQTIELESQRYMMTSEKVKEYFNDGTTTITETSQKYHPTYPALKEESAINSLGNTITNTYYYPDEKASLRDLDPEQSQAIDNLLNNKRYTLPIQIENYNGSQKIYTKRIDFKDWSNGIIAPLKQKAAKGLSTLEDRIKYNKYNANGKPVSLSQTNGTEISYVYGYKKSVVIAELKNISHSSIPESTITTLHNLSDADINIDTEQQLRVALDQLRTTFPTGQITTYTYDPLIGVTSITDPKGNAIFYEYDEFNRLKTIRDLNQYILKEYCYGYKGTSSPCDSSVPNAPDGISIQLETKTYNVPIPNPIDLPEYSWEGIEINNEYNYKSLHPVLFFPRPRHIHDQEPNIRTTPISSEYILPHPLDYYSSGWEADRKGMSFKLEGLNISTTTLDPNYSLDWGIIINGTRLPLLGKIPELYNVIFPPKCLQGVKGSIYCKVRNLNTGETFIVESDPVVFRDGMVNNDNQTEPWGIGGYQLASNDQYCELIASIDNPHSDTDTVTNPDSDWEDTNWDIDLEQDPDSDTDTTGGSGGEDTNAGPIQIHIDPYEKFKIPIPNHWSVSEYPWGGSNTRNSLHPILYFPRPQIPDNPTPITTEPINVRYLTLPYPNSYYSSGWYAERGGYHFTISGLNTLDTPYRIKWLFKIGNTEYDFGGQVPESDSIFFVPYDLKNKEGRVICRISKGPINVPSEIVDIKSPIMIFQEGLYKGDKQSSFLLN